MIAAGSVCLDAGEGARTHAQVELSKIVEREGSCIGYKNKEELLYGLKMLVNNVVLLRDDEVPALSPSLPPARSRSFARERARAHAHSCPHRQRRGTAKGIAGNHMAEPLNTAESLSKAESLNP